MQTSIIAKRSPIARWGIWLGLCVWVLLLVARAHDAAPVALDVWNEPSRAALFDALLQTALGALSHFARFLPLGFLAVLSLPSRDRWLDRVWRSWLPAALGSLLLASVVQAVRAGFELSELLLPWLGCLVGCWAGMAWTRGALARLLFLPEFALLTALLAAALGGLVMRAIEPAPLQLQSPTITSAEKRRLYALFAGKNPLQIEQGNVVDLRLTSTDINLLIAWGLSVNAAGRSAQVDLGNDNAKVQISIPIAGHRRYLNLTAEGTLSLGEGLLKLRANRLRLGRVEVPGPLLAPVSRRVSRDASNDLRIKPLLQVLRRIEIKSDAMTLTYGHGEPPTGFIARLFHHPDANQVDVAQVRAYIANLVATARPLPSAGDARFALAVQTAFRFAHERSVPQHAVEESRNAILALGIVLGHVRVASLLGMSLDARTLDAVRNAYRGATLRKREDWPKHFFVSAALTVIAASNVSNASGLFKEEKDAAGGSGFSFGDLLADRAGTTFAEVATRSEASARAFAEKLCHGFDVNEYFPSAQGLPEDLSDAEFQARYGGVGGEGYRRLMNEIERRIAGCAAYRPTP